MTAYVRCEYWNPHHETKTSRAYATRCNDEATHVVIYGCIDLHIYEKAYCPEHLYAWESMVYDQKGYCPFPPCPGLIELWEKIPIGQVTLAYMMKLARR